LANICREDLSVIDPTKLQAGAALIGTLAGVLYEPGFGAALTGMGSGGTLASGMMYMRERWELSSRANEIEMIKRML